MKKDFIIGTIAGLTIAGASFVYANTQIQAILNNQIKVTLDGATQEFRDEMTNEIQYPITYNDRTYLPLRTVANLVGVGVDYDANTKTAKLTSNTGVKVEYQKETFVLRNTSGEFITNTREIPTVIYSNQDIADKITKELQKINDEYWNNATSAAHEYVDMTNGYDDLGLTIEYSDYELIGNYLKMQLIQSGYFGGVGWNDNNLAIFDLNTGDKVSLISILDDEKGFVDAVEMEFKNEVNKVYQEYLKSNPDYEKANPDSKINGSFAEGFYGLSENWEVEFRKLILEDGNWSITKNGMEFCLPKYSIGIGALGTPTFNVSKEVVNKYLKIEL